MRVRCPTLHAVALQIAGGVREISGHQGCGGASSHLWLDASLLLGTAGSLSMVRSPGLALRAKDGALQVPPRPH
jgi:hypothetical protein